MPAAITIPRDSTIQFTDIVTNDSSTAKHGFMPKCGTGVAAAVGNATNGASGIVVLDGTAKLPAVDGSQLTNLSAGLTATQTTYLHIALAHATWS